MTELVVGKYYDNSEVRCKCVSCWQLDNFCDTGILGKACLECDDLVVIE